MGCGGGLIAGWVAAVGYGEVDSPYYTQPAADVTVTLTAPERVTAGDEFDLIVDVTDTRGVARTLYDIDVDEGLAEHFDLVAVSPMPVSQTTDSAYWTTTHNRPIGSHGTVSVTLTAQATKSLSPGIYTGTVAVYMESYSVANQHITIEVLPVDTSLDVPEF